MKKANMPGSRGGFAMVFTLIILILIVLMVVTFSAIAYNELAMAQNTSYSLRSYYTAEAGIARKFMDLRAGNTGNLNASFPIGSAGSGSYAVSVTLVQAGVFPTYRLTSTGTYRGATRTISFSARQVSCARYSYMSNDEDQLYWWGEQPIWFITRDTLRGPFHSNDQINISGDPTFEGPVSSSDASINYYHGGPPNDNPQFNESLSLGVPTIQLPSAANMLNNLKAQAQAPEGLYLTGNSAITLLADGTMDVTNSNKKWKNRNVAVPQNGALYVDNGYVDVSGTLNGQMTVGTSSSIYVVNDLRYANDPRIDPNSTDLLGLVASNNVYVDRYAPYNIAIDAYIVALNTSFGVENYASALKGTITLYGGITQYRRGPVGTFNGTTGERVSGYIKDYYYDERYEGMAPPYFPPAVDANGNIIYIKTLYTES